MSPKLGYPFGGSDHPVFGDVAGASVRDNLPDKARDALAKTPLNQAPDVSLNVLVPALPENADTTSRIALAEIVVTDDSLGENVLSLQGADADYFEIDGNVLYLKAGTQLDFETKTSFDVSVVVDDPALGSGPEDTESFSLDIIDVPEGPNLDIVLANFGQTNQLLANDGSGDFATSDLAGPAFNSTDIELGDVDADGDLDAVVANNGQLNHLLINDGSGTFTQVDLPGDTFGDFSQDVALGDLDGDGDLDIVVANASRTNRVLFNDGSGNFTSQDLPEGTSGASAVALADIDSDGDLDMVVGRALEDELLINHGDGTFTSTSLAGTSGLTTDVAFGDIDGDGDLDVALLHNSGSSKLLLNDGSGNFTVEDWSVTGNAIAFGDLDNDGDLDAVLARTVDRLLINDGSGNFEISNLDDPGWSSSDVDLIDADNDGDLDIFVTNESEFGPNFLYINEDGTFVATELEGTQSSQAAAVGDVNGDGGVAPVNDAGLPNIDLGTDLLSDSTVTPIV